MRFEFKSPLSVAFAMSFGLVVLLGYIFSTNLEGQTTMLGLLRDYFLRGAVVMAGVALFVGVVNLASVHTEKIKKRDSAGYSILLLVTLISTLLIGIYDIWGVYASGDQNLSGVQWLFSNIQIPVGNSLMALLAISLAFASARLFRRRMNMFSFVFLSVLILLIFVTIPLFSNLLPILSDIRNWIINVPVVGGARGILIGVALGVIATGIRILIGSDRPYKG